jgi:hypothetical protein
MRWSRKHRRNDRGEVETRIEFADGKELPAVAELVPRSLFARVHLDEEPWPGSGAIPCWTYVSDGLRAHGQKELLLTLRRNDDEPPETFPREPFRFFTLMHSFAEQGRVVDAGDYSLLSAPFFRRRSTPFTAVAYIRRSPPSGFDLSAPHLGAILLTPDEGEVLQSCGVARVLARLGAGFRFYPYPEWVDRRRVSVVSKKWTDESIVSQMPVLHLPGAFVRFEGNRIVLRLLPGAGKRLGESIREVAQDRPAAVLTEVDPEANGCLTWRPGQQQPEAITPPESDGSALCGCFIGFVPEQDADAGQVFEDGFLLMLTADSWHSLREAITSGHPLELPPSLAPPPTPRGVPPSADLGFALEWIEDEYVNR